MIPINEELYDPELIKSKLAKGVMRSETLLANLRFLQPEFRKTSEFGDPRHFPFYFYLGQQLQSENVLQIGSQSGLVGAAFLQGCRTVESWRSLDMPQNISASLLNVARGNIQKHCGGEVKASYITKDELMQNANFGLQKGKIATVDTAFVSYRDERQVFKAALAFAWNSLIVEGLLIADYIHSDMLKSEFESFCRVKNRKFIVFDTRYGVGVIQR